ncbi:FYVE RhoGEF and PH domain-containing protein 6 [Crotalus adamanteus]|uniref:FYVE RhoGEF and PH domain-containing protein 6 n=1 Tax=Crotalus adamanteus TaxID=8729 RepID=A0AAW1BC95_CROAD
MNMKMQNSSGAESQDANMYEVEELYEPTGNCLEFGRSSAERDGSELMLEDIHSDDEIMPRDMNSSDDDDDDDDDTNSDSSKGESDAQENKQFRAAGKKTKVYHIAKEIMSSEKVFVDVLKLLHIDFRDSVAHASRQFGKPVIEDKILNQILYYLPQLYELNRDLLRELEERLSHWIDHQRIADIFVKKGPYLKMYSTYIKEFDRNITLLDEHCKKNPGFAAVVREFEMSPRCANLALKHYLLKPVQRIPQYRLLLTEFVGKRKAQHRPAPPLSSGCGPPKRQAVASLCVAAEHGPFSPDSPCSTPSPGGLSMERLARYWLWEKGLGKVSQGRKLRPARKQGGEARPECGKFDAGAAAGGSAKGRPGGSSEGPGGTSQAARENPQPGRAGRLPPLTGASRKLWLLPVAGHFSLSPVVSPCWGPRTCRPP